MKEVRKSLRSDYGPVVKETLAGNTLVHLFNPDDISKVLTETDNMPLFPPLALYRTMRGLGPGLGNVNGDEWYKLRSLIQSQMMRPKAVEEYLPLINEVAAGFLSRLLSIRTPSQDVLDLNTEVSKWHLESTFLNFYETRMGFFENEKNDFFDVRKLIETCECMIDHATSLKYTFPMYKYARTPAWTAMVENADYFFGSLQKVLDHTINDISTLSARKQLPQDKYSFLRQLMRRAEGLPYEQWGMLAVDAVFDGLIATPYIFMENLFTLAKHEHVQDKLFEEIEKIVPRGENVSTKHIKKLKYLKACVKETFRFFPLAVELPRIPRNDIVIGGYQIPKGTQLALNSIDVLDNPEYFFDPEKFQPERWFRGASIQNFQATPRVMLPFGYGPRMCIGRRIAEQEMYVMMIKIVQKFRLQWLDNEDLGQVYKSVLVPDRTARIRFIER